MLRTAIAVAASLAAFGHARAADLPAPAPPPEPAAPYNWTGIYLGFNGGYAFGGTTWSDSITGVSSGNFAVNGLLFGGTVGANYQIGAFVLGVEADGDWADVSGAGTFTAASFCAGGCLMRNGWLATVRGRAGYAIDRILVYGTAGGAFGEVQAGFSNHTASRSTEPGWTAGAGVEYAVLPNLTAKFEYLFVELANGSCTADCALASPAGPPAIPNIAVKFSESLVRAGVNYKFAW